MSNWRRVSVAIMLMAGVLIAGIFTITSVVAGHATGHTGAVENNGEEGDEVKPETKAKPKAGLDVVDRPVLPVGVVRAIKPASLEGQGNSQAEESEGENGEEDLDHKQTIETYTLLLVVAAFASVVLTFVGVYLIRKTMIYTREALDSANDTNKAAWKSVKDAREATKAQLRPYVTIKSVYRDKLRPSRQHDPELPAFVVEVINGGQTPALDVRIQAATNQCPFPITAQDVERREFHGEPMRTVIGPGGGVFRTVPLRRAD